jgi:hypothetical protein
MGARLRGLFHKRIATCRIAELQIAERGHWPLPWKHIATANARVLQFAILQFCKLQFFYEIGPSSSILNSEQFYETNPRNKRLKNEKNLQVAQCVRTTTGDAAD